MNNEVNYISINDWFWVQIKPHLISFQYKGLPPDIHLTLSFHPDKPHINLHLTKNTKDSKSKPTIKVVEMDKSFIQILSSRIVTALLSSAFVPVKISDITQEVDKLYFLPFEALEKNNGLEHEMMQHFRNITSFTRKNTRVKVVGDIGAVIEGFSDFNDLHALIHNSIKEFSADDITPGFVLSSMGSLLAAKFNGEYFTMKCQIEPWEFLGEVLTPDISKVIKRKYKKSLVDIRNAETYADVSILNNPLSLSFKSVNAT